MKGSFEWGSMYLLAPALYKIGGYGYFIQQCLGPPIFLCSGAFKRSKILFPRNFGSFQTDLSLFLDFFSTKSEKNEKTENILKIAKKWANFKISQFLTYFNILYKKRKHFFKDDFLHEKLNKHQIFKFFIKIEADQLSLTKNFWKLYQWISNLSWAVLLKGFEIKSHQRTAHYLWPFRNDGLTYDAVGQIDPLSPGIGLI